MGSSEDVRGGRAGGAPACGQSGRASALVIALAIVVGGAGAGCGRRASADAGREGAAETSTAARTARAASAHAPKALRRRPKTAAELPTTAADIFLENLDGQIAELTRLVGEMPDHASNVQRLGAAIHLRGRVRGDVDELQRGIDLTSTCVRLEPTNATCVLLRGEQQQSLHRFEAARADLERARELHADAGRMADLAAELDWNAGRYDEAIARIREARARRPSPATLLREAQLDHDLGLDQDRIDASFEGAEDRIEDPSPLPVAHLNLQRGIQRMQRGLVAEALPFFREAVLRMPASIPATEHLAEALHAAGQDEEATRLYEQITSRSDDPEFAHALAELYRASGDAAKKARAAALEAKARARYEELLSKYPEAMYWHASEFFLATGDAKRALELLRKNVTLRPNSASWVALARAELANGLAAEAKASIDKALAMPVRSASLFWTAGRVYAGAGAGDAATAEAYRKRAIALNPRIEKDEP